MYFQLSKCTFSQQFQYRESIGFQLIGMFMWVYIQICIWNVLLKYQVDGRSFEEMVVYVLASQALGIFSHSNVAANLAEKVKTGAIAVDLIRPINLKWYSFWEQISTNMFQFLMVGLPVFAVVIVLWPILPLKLVNVLLFLASSGLAVLLNFYFQYSVGLLVFWFKDGTYAKMMIGGLMTIFSGKEIPLWFYPAFLYSLCSVLPFRFMVYEPVAILLGQYRGNQISSVLMMQALWIGVLWIVERIVWHKVQKQIEIQGG